MYKTPIKERVALIVGGIVLILIAVVSICYNQTVLDHAAMIEKKVANPHKEKEEILRDNFCPGKDEALKNATRYVDMAESGSAFSREGISEELKAFGYTDEEIEYALNTLDESVNYGKDAKVMVKKLREKDFSDDYIKFLLDKTGFTGKDIKTAMEI